MAPMPRHERRAGSAGEGPAPVPGAAHGLDEAGVERRPRGAAAEAILPGIAPASGAAARPPSPAMREFVEDLAARPKAKPPAGHTKSAAVCHTFLDRHAPKRAHADGGGNDAPRKPGAAQRLFVERIAQRKGIEVPEEAKARVRNQSAWIDANRGKAGRRPTEGRGRKAAVRGLADTGSRPAPRRPRKAGSAASKVAARGTALKIPFGNKEAAMRLGARYGDGGWVAPPGTDLEPFRERGWL
jgi:DNA topoisomerase III